MARIGAPRYHPLSLMLTRLITHPPGGRYFLVWLFILAINLVGGLALAAPAAHPSSGDFSIAHAGIPLLSPPFDANGRVEVNVALHVLNLSNIDEVTENFDLTGYLLAHWRDPRLAYQPAGPN